MYYEIWTYRDNAYPDDVNPSGVRTAGDNMREGIDNDLVGFRVEALDGHIGHVDEATHEAGSSYIVVDTGPWIFGKKVMLPAGVISQLDSDNQTVSVNRTKEEIKNSPEFDETTYQESAYRDRLGSYYGPEGPGYRDW